MEKTDNNYSLPDYISLLDEENENTDYSSLIIRDVDITNDEEKYLQRRRNLEFQISQSTYFGTIATLLDIMRQEKRLCRKKQDIFLKNLKEDLIYLQENYKIVKK